MYQYDPSKPAYFVDYGQSRWTILNSVTNQVRQLTREEFLSLAWLDENVWQIVVEAAHLNHPRTKRSLAQPHTKEELLDLFDRLEACGVDLFMFPHHVTSTVRSAAGLDAEKRAGEDEADCRALRDYLREHRVNMARPHKSFDLNTPFWQAVFEFRRETNAILNFARMFPNYDVEPDPVIGFDGTDHVKELLLSMEMGFENGRNSRRRGALAAYELNGIRCDRKKRPLVLQAIKSMGNAQLYMLGVMLKDPRNGERRLRVDTGLPPGITWLRDYQVGFTGFHHRGGVARSNLMYHGMRNFCLIRDNQKKAIPLGRLSKEQRHVVDQRRRAYRFAVVHLLQKMRDFITDKKLKTRLL